jgi:hypothetical protein
MFLLETEWENQDIDNGLVEQRTETQNDTAPEKEPLGRSRNV